MQTIFITGRVGANAETRQAGGSEVTSFNVAVDQGSRDNKTTNWYRVSIWGDRGRKLAGHILKGNKIAVTGDFEIGEYNGKPQFNVRANDVDPWLGNGGSPRHEGGAGGSDRPAPLATEQPFAGLEHVDDDVPF